MRSVLNARSGGDGPGALQPGEIGLILDGGKQGNKNKLLAPWKEGTSREGNKKGAAAEDEEEEGQTQLGMG